jgi:hypothetical protein
MSAPAHSKWSASGFESIMLCPGKKVLEQGKPDNTSKYAAEGTAAHQVLTWALQEERPATAYIGRVIEADGFVFEVDQDMAGHVQVCVDYANDLKGDDGTIFADIRVNYSSYLGVAEQEAWGTADVIVCRGTEVIVVDFKYGMGVEVDAERNPQMSLYGLGALQAYHGLVADFETVRMAISQPRIKRAPSEWDCSVEELEAWGRSTARSAVVSCLNAGAILSPDQGGMTTTEWEDTFLRPTEKGCKFCRAKATCPALRVEVAQTVRGDYAPATPEEFSDMTLTPVSSAHDDDLERNWLAACLSKVDLIEDWCKAIRAETERRLLAGDNVPGFKLVQGKRSARQWTDAKVAEETLKTMRVKLEDMYDFKLISPTTADKLAKAGTIGPRQWPKLQSLITQSEGKPHVAPSTDSRPALVVTPVVDDFTDVTPVDDLA